MHVILYVLDSIRADHLGCYGYERDTSPCLDALAADGVVFGNCFTSSTWTRPVAASLLTGTYPGVHGTQSRHDAFVTNLPRLPEVLRDAGYATAGFSTIGHLDSNNGFGRGFDRYLDLFRQPEILAKREVLDASHEGLLDDPDGVVALPRAEDVNEQLFPWLSENSGRDSFSFVWTIDPHVPFSPPEGYRRFSAPSATHAGAISGPGRRAGSYADARAAGEGDRQRLIDLYDDEISYADAQLGALVGHLGDLGIYEETLLIVTGDHGESFFEHGLYGHGHAPFDEVVRVPLIVKLPAAKVRAQADAERGADAGVSRVDHLVELVDIYPTITACAGLLSLSAGGGPLQGHALLPLIEHRADPVRQYVYSETRSLAIHNRYLSVRSDRWKYIEIERPERDARSIAGLVQHVLQRKMLRDIIRAPRHFFRSYFQHEDAYLFDLAADPQERVNLMADRPDRAADLARVLADWQTENEELAKQFTTMAYDYEESEAMKRHLESLGYE